MYYFRRINDVPSSVKDVNAKKRRGKKGCENKVRHANFFAARCHAKKIRNKHQLLT